MGIHQQRTHPAYVEGCWTCRVSTVHVGALAGQVRDMGDREKVLDKDLDAYKRMRDQGWRPAATKGAARVEKEARNQFEVENPKLMGLDDVSRKHAAEATQVARSIDPLLSAHQKGTP